MADWLHPGVRFLHYALLLGLFGLTAFRAVGLRQIAPGSDAGRWPAVIACALLAPCVSVALMIVAIADMMGQPVSMLDWATIETMVISTSMGWAFIARVALLSLALAALGLLPKAPLRWPVAALFHGFALLTLAWSGHAAAADGMLGLVHRLNDGLHLLAAGLWLGAIGWFLTLVIGAHRNPEQIAPEPLLDTMHRFAPLGVTLVAFVAATGLINAHLIFGLGNSAEVLKADYGGLLIAKAAMVVLMLLCGARNAAVGRRRARAGVDSCTSTTAILAALRTSLAVELFLATIVLVIVALVGLASPMG